MIKILKKSSEFKKFIEGSSVVRFEKFVQSEFLSNYLLGAELELKLGSSWVLDTKRLEKFKNPEFPDLTFKKGKLAVYLEIKGQLSRRGNGNPYLSNTTSILFYCFYSLFVPRLNTQLGYISL